MEAATALAEIENEKAIEHLFNNVKACLTNSSYGITFSALTDIYKGEEVFLRWDGPTREYFLSVERAKELHQNVFGTLLRYFYNHSHLEKGVVSFKLVHGVNFVVAQPECILTPDGEGGNLETGTMKARWDILPGTKLTLATKTRSNLL